MSGWFRFHGDVIKVSLYVQPGAKRNEIVGLHGDALKIKLAAPPIEGRANEALKKYLGKIFGVPLRNIELLHGDQSRHKVLSINGSLVDPDSILSSK